jgi:hypothetical protein
VPSAPAMGSVKQALGGNDLFYSVGVLLSDGVIGEFFLFPPNPLAVGGALRGSQRLSVDQWFFFLERFLFVLPGEYCFSASGNLLSAGAFEKIARQHYDVFGSGRGTSTLNLQSGLLWPRGASEGAPFQSLLAHIPKAFLFSGTEALSPASRG